jgi:outer membrane protein OmpA-like peptidoglycan-associated protein
MTKIILILTTLLISTNTLANNKIATQAEYLTKQGKLKQAENVLKRATTMTWKTQKVYGEIAANRQQWNRAAKFFNQALKLTPPVSEVKKLYKLSEEAQLLAGEVGDIVDSVRSTPRINLLMPIYFNYGSSTPNARSRNTIKIIVNHLKQRRASRLILIGHSDKHGSHRACNRVSIKRAKAVKNYFRKYGVKTHIAVIGKGKRQPLRFYNRWKLKPSQIDALNRRVEIRIR